MIVILTTDDESLQYPLSRFPCRLQVLILYVIHPPHQIPTPTDQGTAAITRLTYNHHKNAVLSPGRYVK